MSDFKLPSATQWGIPSSTKRALLVHGLGCSSLTWERVAEALAREGYFVVAPNLIGHGFRTGTDFRMATVARDLHPYLAHADYDVIIAHSWGSAVVATLLSSLPRSRPTSLVLVDPSLEFPPEFVKAIKEEWANSVANIKSVEDFMEQFPKWTRLDAITRVVGLQACAFSRCHSRDFDGEFRSIFRVAVYSIGFVLFERTPGISKMIQWAVRSLISLIVLRTSPSPFSLQIPEVEKHIPKHSQITCSIIPGVTHWVQYEAPERIVDAALQSVGEGQKA
ncbi:Alpha/Beta hydrolase protein [Pisolithus croceorrhizus]|nr:Alpha/Beta hydrolase protein [Pisolithus croceorrhizus]